MRSLTEYDGQMHENENYEYKIHYSCQHLWEQLTKKHLLRVIQKQLTNICEITLFRTTQNIKLRIHSNTNDDETVHFYVFV